MTKMYAYYREKSHFVEFLIQKNKKNTVFDKKHKSSVLSLLYSPFL